MPDRAIHNPQRRRRCRPLSGSEHNPSTQPAAPAAPLFWWRAQRANQQNIYHSYDTESKSRNVLASPLGEEGHEVAKGCTRVRMIMILDVDVTAKRRHYNTHCPIGRYRNVRPEGPSILRTFSRGAADWRSGPRWSILSVLCPVHPFPLRGTSPQGETRDMREKTGESYTSCTIPVFPPLVPYGTTFPPQFGGAAKGKRLNGQARRLTSPHLEVLCRTSTVAL